MKKLILISLLALSTWVCSLEKASAQYVTYYPNVTYYPTSYAYPSGPTVWAASSYSYHPTYYAPSYYAPSYTYPTSYYAAYPAPQYYSYPTYPGGYYYRSGLLGRRVYYYPAY